MGSAPRHVIQPTPWLVPIDVGIVGLARSSRIRHAIGVSRGCITAAPETWIRSRIMDVATFVLAVLGVVLSALALGWQAATFVLTGGRVRVELLVGAVRDNHGMVTMSARNPQPDWAASLVEQGYRHPVVAVRVRNVGRLAVSVERWSIVTLLRKPQVVGPFAQAVVQLSKREEGPEVVYPGLSLVGPDLPHRLEAGASVIWAAPFGEVNDLIAVTKNVYSVAGKVALGDGRSSRSKDMIRA